MAVISSASWEDCLVAVELQPIYALQFEKLCLKQILFLLAHQLHLLQVDRVISCIAHACLCTGRFRGTSARDLQAKRLSNVIIISQMLYS